LNILRMFAAAMLAGAGLAGSMAAQAAWPADRPMSLVVPFPPGGATDIVGRTLAEALGKQLHQTVIVDNRGGAGGTIGAAYVSRAKPDGYTLFLATIAHTIAPSIYDTLSYDFEKDFAPVTLVASSPNMLIVNKDLPVNSVADLIRYAEAHPGELNFGSAGTGSIEHVSAELFARTAKVDIRHVPYKGSGPMLTDLISGQIQMAMETSGASIGQIRAHTVKVLGVSSAKPSSYFPEIPAIDESGLPGYSSLTWYGLLAPARTPADVVDKLHQAAIAALQSPEMKQTLQSIGADPGGNTPAQFAAYIAEQTKTWHEVLKGGK